MGSRTWIKIYCDKWLSGTLREEQPAHRGIWIDLLALAGTGRYGDTGEIKLSEGVGLTDTQIAAILKVPLELWLEAKRRFIDTERISIVLDNNIVITNWQKYQSEYERQKSFRVESDTEKLQPKVTGRRE